MELMTSDARYEKTWHQFLSALEMQPRLRLAPFLRSQHVYQRGFEKWMYSHGHSVGDAKGRILHVWMRSHHRHRMLLPVSFPLTFARMWRVLSPIC